MDEMPSAALPVARCCICNNSNELRPNQRVSRNKDVYQHTHLNTTLHLLVDVVLLQHVDDADVVHLVLAADAVLAEEAALVQHERVDAGLSRRDGQRIGSAGRWLDD